MKLRDTKSLLNWIRDELRKENPNVTVDLAEQSVSVIAQGKEIIGVRRVIEESSDGWVITHKIEWKGQSLYLGYWAQWLVRLALNRIFRDQRRADNEHIMQQIRGVMQRGKE